MADAFYQGGSAVGQVARMCSAIAGSTTVSCNLSLRRRRDLRRDEIAAHRDHEAIKLLVRLIDR